MRSEHKEQNSVEKSRAAEEKLCECEWRTQQLLKGRWSGPLQELAGGVVLHFGR